MKTLRKSFCAIIILCMVALTTSCNSLLNLLEQGITEELSAKINEPALDIINKCNAALSNKTYLRLFKTKDYYDTERTVCIVDDNYMVLHSEDSDPVVYAYRIDSLMYYSHVLTGFKGKYVVPNTEKLIGFKGYATNVLNPNITISFVIQRDVDFTKSNGYRSAWEAAGITGYSFGNREKTRYVDDFGRVCYHKFQDYFDDIFLTSKRDIVNKKMYLAISILNKSEQ